MCPEEMCVQIVCVVPTSYKGTMNAIKEERMEWPVPQPQSVESAVEWQMKKLAEKWACWTGSRLRIVPRVDLSATSVRSLELTCGGSRIEITAPSPKVAFSEHAGGAALRYFWIVYPRDVANRLRAAKRGFLKGHSVPKDLIAWIPSSAGELVDSLREKRFRQATNDEFRHCLVRLMKDAGVAPDELPTRCEEKKHSPRSHSPYLISLLLKAENWGLVSDKLEHIQRQCRWEELR